MSTVQELLSEAIILLKKTSPSAALDALILLEWATGFSRLKIAAEPQQSVDEKVAGTFRSFVQRRALSEPIAYITGRKEFFGLEFKVNENVLTPRPETELIVEKALEFLSTRIQHFSVLDLGTGSGCIIVSLVHELLRKGKSGRFLAVDVSERAVVVAKENAALHKVASAIEFKVSDWFSNLSPDDELFDLIVSNPPYIAQVDTNVSPELRFEPARALFAENKGISDIEKILRDAPRFLKPGGLILLETGASQHEQVRTLFPNYQSIETSKDLAGHDRVLALFP